MTTCPAAVLLATLLVVQVSLGAEFERAQPKERIQGDRSRGSSSKFNAEWEVGNFGVYVGNCGDEAL